MRGAVAEYTGGGALLLRAAVESEAAVLTALALSSKQHWGYDAAFMRRCREELTVRSADIGGGRLRYVVAVFAAEAPPVGFYALAWRSAVAELEALFVAPAHIGTGIGRALLAHALQTARDGGAAVLTVQSDPHAAAFYRAAGGVEAGARESESIAGRMLPVFEYRLR